MGSFRDDSSTASLIHKPTLTITEDDATTVQDDMMQSNGVRMGRCGMPEHCECGSMSCQNRELYVMTLYLSCCCFLVANPTILDNCQLPRRPYTNPGLWHIIGPQCMSALSSRDSAFFSISSRQLHLYQVDSCQLSQRHNLHRRSSPM